MHWMLWCIGCFYDVCTTFEGHRKAEIFHNFFCVQLETWGNFKYWNNFILLQNVNHIKYKYIFRLKHKISNHLNWWSLQMRKKLKYLMFNFISYILRLRFKKIRKMEAKVLHFFSSRFSFNKFLRFDFIKAFLKLFRKKLNKVLD